MGFKKLTFSSLAKTQLHHNPYFISLFYFLIYFYYFIILFIYFFRNSQNTLFSHFLSLSPSVPIVYSPPLPPSHFSFFPPTHVPHLFNFFFPTTHVPPSLSFFFLFLLLLHKSSVKSLRLLLHPQFRPSSQSDWDPHTCSLGETH